MLWAYYNSVPCNYNIKNMKRIYFFMLLLLSIVTFSQQDPQYTQYNYNMNVINPAYAGSKGYGSLNFLARRQWVGVEGAPKTLSLSYNTPLGKSLGLGVNASFDEIGPVKETLLYADFSYTLYLGERLNLAFGLKGGMTFLNVRTLDLLDNNDKLNVPINLKTPNFGAGFYLYTDTYYIGFSVPNLIKTRHLEDKLESPSTSSENMHFFTNTGYVFTISDDLKLKPSTMLKFSDNSPLSVDLSLNLLYKNIVELGLSHRLDDSISAIVGFQASENFRIGYAYDLTLSSYQLFNSGSHELLLTYDFIKNNIKSPRFF